MKVCLVDVLNADLPIAYLAEGLDMEAMGVVCPAANSLL
jgi:hypothetical protein